MKELGQTLKTICREQRRLLVMMILLAVLSLGLVIFALLNLKAGNPSVKVGYGDIGRYQGGEWSSMKNAGGYRDGHWTSMLVFPVFGLVLGVLHNALAVKLFKQRGSGLATVFVTASILLLLAGFVILIRLIGQG